MIAIYLLVGMSLAFVISGFALKKQESKFEKFLDLDINDPNLEQIVKDRIIGVAKRIHLSQTITNEDLSELLGLLNLVDYKDLDLF